MFKSFAVFAAICGLSAAQSVPTLHPDVPVRQSVAEGHCNYYSIEEPGSAGSFNLSVTVSPLEGDADIFMNCGPGMPSSSHYVWRSIHFGEDSVDVFQDDPNFCSSRFVLGVCGFTNSTYVVEANIHKGKKAFSWLIDGVPVTDEVEMGETVYYAVNVPKTDSDGLKSAVLDVVVTPHSGDPDVFIGCEPYPTAQTAKWASWSRQVDAIAINRTDPNLCTDGTYYIAVYGFEAAEFTLAATVPRGRAEYLYDHEPVRDVVYGNQYQYYQFRAGFGGNHDVTIRVKAENDPSFDADLYISCGTTPSRSAYTWGSAHGGGLEDKIVIPESDSKSCVHSGQPFMVAVYGFRYSVFRVEAFTGTETQTALRGPLRIGA